MALEDQFFAFITVGTSNKKRVSYRHRVKAETAGAYLSAATQVLKDATALGVHLLAAEALMKGTFIEKGVELRTIENAADQFPDPDTGIFGFDKFGVKYNAGLDNYQVTLPTRDMDVVDMESNGVNVNIDAGATDETTDFITSFELVAQAKNGGSVTVKEMLVVS